MAQEPQHFGYANSSGTSWFTVIFSRRIFRVLIVLGFLCFLIVMQMEWRLLRRYSDATDISVKGQRKKENEDERYSSIVLVDDDDDGGALAWLPKSDKEYNALELMMLERDQAPCIETSWMIERQRKIERRRSEGKALNAVVQVVDKVNSRFPKSRLLNGVMGTRTQLMTTNSSAVHVLLASMEECGHEGALVDNGATEKEKERKFLFMYDRESKEGGPKEEGEGYSIRYEDLLLRRLGPDAPPECQELIEGKVVDELYLYNQSLFRDLKSVNSQVTEELWLEVFFKFASLALPRRLYRRVFSLDCDMLLVNPLDAVFAEKAPAMVRWGDFINPNNENANSGAFLFEPSVELHAAVWSYFASSPPFDRDQSPRERPVYQTSLEVVENKTEQVKHFPLSRYQNAVLHPFNQSFPAHSVDGRTDQGLLEAFFLSGDNHHRWQLHTLSNAYNLRWQAYARDLHEKTYSVVYGEMYHVILLHFTPTKPYTRAGNICKRFKRSEIGTVCAFWRAASKNLCNEKGRFGWDTERFPNIMVVLDYAKTAHGCCLEESRNQSRDRVE